MTRRLLTLLSLSVLADFTKSGANEKRGPNKIDNEETKRIQEINTKWKEANDRLRHQLEIKDLEIIKKNQKMEAIESAAVDWKTNAQWWRDEANRRTEWWKGREKLWGLKYLEFQHRAAIQKEGMESRIQMLAEELLKQRMLAQVMEDLQLSNEILRRQLAETKQNICLPDSPTHEQVGGTCMKYATATWIRKTLTEQFLRGLPRHHEIVEALPKFHMTWQEQLESIKKEAERWNLKIEELDMSKEGAFDQVHKLLEDRHPLYLSFQNWGAIKQHCQESSSEYLGAQEWDANTYAGGSHGMVLTEYIPPQHGKPGLYKIKNSHGEWGGSFGQRGYILIEDKVFRAMNVRHALVARKSEWKEESLQLKSQIHKLTEQLSFSRNLATSKGIQKMEAKENIENLKKQLAEAKQKTADVRLNASKSSLRQSYYVWEKHNRCEIEKEQLETRIKILDEQLSNQMFENKLMTLKLKAQMCEKIEDLKEQLKQDVRLPDTPTHNQRQHLTCWKFASASWMRSTAIRQFLRRLPAHDEILENLPDDPEKSGLDWMDLVKGEAGRCHLEMKRLDLTKKEGFDRAHELLKDGHPLLLSLPPTEWGPLKRYLHPHVLVDTIDWNPHKSPTAYLEVQEFERETVWVSADGHALVVMEYIPPNDGKPGLYKIKNSHGKDGGSPGQNGHILIDEEVLRRVCLNPTTDVFVALPQARKNICTTDNLKHKDCSPICRSVAFAIWQEINAKKVGLTVTRCSMTKEGAFELLERGYPILLTLKRGEWDPVLIESYIYEASNEYLGLNEWDKRRYRMTGHAFVVTGYTPPNKNKPGLYKIKTSLGEHGNAPGQKGYILIEDKVLEGFNVEFIFVAMPEDEATEFRKGFCTTDGPEHKQCERKEEALRLKTQIHKLTEQLSFYQNLATSNQIQKLETSEVMESMKMEARANIENLKKQLAEAKQNNCSPGSPVPKQHAVTSMSVAMSIWREMNQFINKDMYWKLVELTVMSMDHFLKQGYPLLFTLKYGEGSVIEKYIDESPREYLGGLEWDISMFRCTGRALVVTEYIPPKESKPGLYKIKTSLGKYGSVPGQKEYILIEDKVLRGLDVTSVFVRIPKDQCADIERVEGK